MAAEIARVRGETKGRKLERESVLVYLEEKADYWKEEARTALSGRKHKRRIACMDKYEALIQAKLDIRDGLYPRKEEE